MVQFLPAAHDVEDDASGCSGTDEREVEFGAAVEGIGEGVRPDHDRQGSLKTVGMDEGDVDHPFANIDLYFLNRSGMVDMRSYGWLVGAPRICTTTSAVRWRISASTDEMVSRFVVARHLIRPTQLAPTTGIWKRP